MGNDVGESIWDEHPEHKKLEAAAKKANERGLKAANKPGPLKVPSKTSGMSTTNIGGMVLKTPRISAGIDGVAGRNVTPIHKPTNTKVKSNPIPGK